jgi:hypothetical protein
MMNDNFVHVFSGGSDPNIAVAEKKNCARDSFHDSSQGSWREFGMSMQNYFHMKKHGHYQSPFW